MGRSAGSRLGSRAEFGLRGLTARALAGWLPLALAEKRPQSICSVAERRTDYTYVVGGPKQPTRRSRFTRSSQRTRKFGSQRTSLLHAGLPLAAP